MLICKTKEDVLDAIRTKKKFIIDSSLSTLYLGDNNIGAEGAKELADALKGNNTLSTLDLRANNIGPEGIKALVNVFKKNSTLTTFYLFNNNIGPEGAKAVAELLQVNSSLATVNLRSNNIGDEGAKFLLEAMKVNCSLNQNKSEDGIAYFIGSGQCNKELQQGLEAEIKINQDPVQSMRKVAQLYLCGKIKTYTHSTLDLSNMSVRSVEFEGFSKKLVSNTYIKELNISNNKIEYIPVHITSMKNLTSLDVSNNRIKHVPCYLSYLKELKIAGNEVAPHLLKLSNEDLLATLKEQELEEIRSLARKVKVTFLGDTGSGKTTILQCLGKARKTKQKNHLITPSTIVLDIFPEDILGIEDHVNYQVWDFAGHPEYGVIIQHFLSPVESIYVIVISLVRDVKPQFEYWTNFLGKFVDISKCGIIFVGTKSDLLEKKQYDEKVSELTELINSEKTFSENDPIIISSVKSSGFKDLQKKIQKYGNSFSVEEIPNSYFLSLRHFENEYSSQLFWREKKTEKELVFLHKIGEIVYFPSAGIASLKPSEIARIMGKFVCPEMHEYIFSDKQKHKKKKIFQESDFKQRLRGILQTIEPYWLQSDTAQEFLFFFQEIGFFLKLSCSESLDYNIINSTSFLIPSLQKIGNFRWNSDFSAKKRMLVFGRRITRSCRKAIPATWFLQFQVKIFHLFHNLCTTTPCLYANGIIFSLKNNHEILIMFSENNLHVNVIISGQFPINIWEIIQHEIWICENTSEIIVDIIDPINIFRNPKTYPLNFDHLPITNSSDIAKMVSEDQIAVKFGKHGHFAYNSGFPWSHDSEFHFTETFGKSNSQIKYLEIFPPKSGSEWKSKIHETEFGKIKTLFESFLGPEHKKSLKLTKIVVLQNPNLEAKFTQMYFNLKNKSHDKSSLFDDEQLEWRNNVLYQLNNFINNIPGDEATNLTLAWHNCRANPLDVSSENFRMEKKKNSGKFGNGTYFSFFGYGPRFVKAKKKFKGDSPLILSWVLMGNAYPVTEKAEDSNPKSLQGKPCKDEFDSHYVLLRNEEKSDGKSEGKIISAQPCDPSEVSPDFDELVIFNKDQILPRYLVYYSQNDDVEHYDGNVNLTHANSASKLRSLKKEKLQLVQQQIYLYWIDPNDNSKLIGKLEENNINIFRFSTSTQFLSCVEKIHENFRSDEIFIAVVSNRYRKGDGDEIAGLRLYQTLRNGNSQVWQNTPFVLFCGNPKLVEMEFPDDELLLVTDDEDNFIEYILKLPKKAKSLQALVQLHQAIQKPSKLKHKINETSGTSVKKQDSQLFSLMEQHHRLKLTNSSPTISIEPYLKSIFVPISKKGIIITSSNNGHPELNSKAVDFWMKSVGFDDIEKLDNANKSQIEAAIDKINAEKITEKRLIFIYYYGQSNSKCSASEPLVLKDGTVLDLVPSVSKIGTKKNYYTIVFIDFSTSDTKTISPREKDSTSTTPKIPRLVTTPKDTPSTVPRKGSNPLTPRMNTNSPRENASTSPRKTTSPRDTSTNLVNTSTTSSTTTNLLSQPEIPASDSISEENIVIICTSSPGVTRGISHTTLSFLTHISSTKDTFPWCFLNWNPAVGKAELTVKSNMEITISPKAKKKIKEYFSKKYLKKEKYLQSFRSEVPSIGTFIPEKLLGFGSGGVVILCAFKPNSSSENIKVAIKIVFNYPDGTPDREIKFHALPFHPNLIHYSMIFSRIPVSEIPSNFVKLFPEQFFTNSLFRTPGSITNFLVMQQHYSLKEFLQSNPAHNQSQLIFFCVEISHALNFLFKHRIVHRDLKIDHILISAGGIPVVCDFGLAEFVDENGCIENQKKIVGNKEHLAPEILNSHLKQINYSKQPSWELGVISHEITTFQHPFESYPNMEIYGIPPALSIPKFSAEKLEKKNFPEKFIQIISNLLVTFEKRITIEQASAEFDSLVL